MNRILILCLGFVILSAASASLRADDPVWPMSEAAKRSYMKDLDSTDWARQRSAVENLAQAGITEAIPRLIQLMNEARDNRVRSHAARYLGEFKGSAEARDALIRHLEQNKPDQNEFWAIGGLGMLGDPTAIPTLRRFMDGTVFDHRDDAIRALARAGDRERIPEFVRLLDDKEHSIRDAACFALGELGAKQQVARILRLMKEDERPSVRATAARSLEALGWTPGTPDDQLALWAATEAWDRIVDFGGNDAAQVLAEELQRRESTPAKLMAALAQLAHPFTARPLIEKLRERSRVVVNDMSEYSRALGSIRPPATDLLLPLLAENNRMLLVTTLDAIGLTGDPRATPAVMKKADHEFWQVRGAAVTALGRIKDERGRSAVIKRMLDAEYSVAGSACEALGGWGGPGAFEELLAVAQNHDARGRSAAIKALGILGDRRALDPLVTMLQTARGDERFAVVAALGDLGDPRATEPLWGLLFTNYMKLPEAAVQALAKLEGNAMARALDAYPNFPWSVRREIILVIPTNNPTLFTAALEKGFADSNGTVRALAVSKIAQLRTSTAFEQVRAAARDPYHDVRLAAAEGLGAFGDPAAISELQSLIRDQDSRISGAAITSLERISHPSVVPVLMDALAVQDVGWRITHSLGRIGEPAIPALRDAVLSDDIRIRERAISALSSIDAKRSKWASGTSPPAYWTEAELRMFRAISNGEWDVVREAGTNAISALRPLLRHPSVDTRAESAQLLMKYGHSPTTDTERVAMAIAGQNWNGVLAEGTNALLMLQQDLRHEDRALRRGCVVVYGRLAGTNAVDDILPMIKDSDPAVRQAAIAYLASLRRPADTRRLMEAAADGDASVNKTARDALTALDATGAVWVARTLSNTEGADKARLLEIAGGLEIPGLSAVMVNHLLDTNEQVRVVAAKQLAERGNAPTGMPDRIHWMLAADKWAELEQDRERVVNYLMACIASRQPLSAPRAAEALGHLKEKRATGLLIAETTSREQPRQKAALQALGRIGGGPHVLEALSKAANQGPADIRITAIRAMGKLGESGAVEPLLTLSITMDTAVQSAVHEAFQQLGSTAIEPLRAKLQGATPQVIEQTAKVLARMKGPGLPPLFQLLANADPSRRMVAVRALVMAGESAGPGLIKALQSVRPEIRQSACWALGELRYTTAKPDIERVAQNDADPIVRLAAKATLDRLNK